MRHISVVLLAIAVSGLPQLSLAGDMADSAIKKAVAAGFSDLERQIIEKYIGKQDTSRKSDDGDEQERDKSKSAKSKGKKDKNGLPPGLAKRDELPPGLAKLQRNGALPPGLAKRDLPADLEKQLPPPPEGYERKIVEDAAVVLVEKASGKVADIIEGIFTDKKTDKR